MKKSLMNARVNAICYGVSLITAFFTRKILIDYLGTDFIGLTGTLGSLLGFLNLAELGVGTAIGYILYKPLFEADRAKINEVISLLGYLYRWIGGFILVAGIVLSAFLPLIFPDTGISMGVIYFGYYAYLSASLVGYFINYHTMLLSADQRNYVVTGWFQATSSAKVILQMVLAVVCTNFYLFLAVELVFSLANALILNIKVRQTYPWLMKDLSEGRGLLKKYPETVKYIKQVFMHKLGGFIQYQTSPLLIYAFVSLPVVTLYTNYTILSGRVQTAVSSILTGTTAGVGNLVAEGNSERIYSIYRQLNSVRVLMAGTVAFCIYYLASPFIAVWLGSQYPLPDIVVALLALNVFVSLQRATNDEFIYTHGIFHDVWAPFVECAISLGVSIALGYRWGLPGVLAGPLVSMFLIVCMWKPYLLYKEGFKRPLVSYLGVLGPTFLPVIAAFIITELICSLHFTQTYASGGWLAWFATAGVFTSLMILLSFGLMWVVCPDFREIVLRFDIARKIRSGFRIKR